MSDLSTHGFFPAHSMLGGGSGLADPYSPGDGELNITGDLNVSSNIFHDAGAAATPAVCPNGDPDTGIWAPAANIWAVSVSGAEALRIAPAGVTLTQPIVNASTPVAFKVTGGAHTACIASTEVKDVHIDTQRTVTFAAGAITTQRSVVIESPTYAFASLSTITNCTTVEIEKCPTMAAASAQATNVSMLRIGTVAAGIGNTSAGMTYSTIELPAYTVAVAGTTQVTSRGFAGISIGKLSIDDVANDAVTINSAASLYIADAPAAAGGSTVTLTTAYALWVDSGTSKFDGAVIGGDGSAAAPAFALESNTNMGLYRVANNTLGLSTAGLEALRMTYQYADFPGALACGGNVAGASVFATQCLSANNEFGEVDASVYGGKFTCSAFETDGASSNVIYGVHSTATLHASNNQNWTDAAALRALSVKTIGAGGSGTVTGAAGVYVENGTATGITLTNQYGIYVETPTGGASNYGVYIAGGGTYALWIDAGLLRYDNTAANDGATAACTLGLTGNNGPTTAAQSIWMKIDMGGTAYWIPAWV